MFLVAKKILFCRLAQPNISLLIIFCRCFCAVNIHNYLIFCAMLTLAEAANFELFMTLKEFGKSFCCCIGSSFFVLFCLKNNFF